MWGILFADKNELNMFETEIFAKIAQKSAQKLVAKPDGKSNFKLFFYKN